MRCSTPAAMAQAPGLSRPTATNAPQLASPSATLVTSSMNMYFGLDALMLSRSCTVIFFCDSDGPAIFTSLRLNVLPEARPKNTMNSVTASWPATAAAVIEPASSHSDRSNAGGAAGGGAGVAATAPGSSVGGASAPVPG